ncbi:MAG: cobalamin-dependent protein [Acidobacteria bacterium]|nr:cobalamin-dependent protein [Acidobacteriota bacterium]
MPQHHAGTRVLLTRAHYENNYRAPGFPVGIALVASYLQSQGVLVRILDLAIQKNWQAALKAEMDNHACGIVGISLQITQYEEASRIAEFIKQNYPGTKVVFGGSFPSSAPRECAGNPYVDVVSYGEGEFTMHHLIQAWENGRSLDSIEGIAFRRPDGSIAQNPPRVLIDDLDKMPLAAYEMFDLEPYVSADHTSDFTKKKYRCMELITSRGCPYSCIYCHSVFGKKFRGRSPQHVIDEILYLHRTHGVVEFVIWDDTFTMDIQRAKDICDLIIRSGIKIAIQLRGGVRVEQMDEELFAKLKQAGVETMCVGIESAVWRIQKMIKKNLKIEKVEALLNLAKKYRITTVGLMMLGFPGESLREMKESIRWACKSKLDYTFFSIVTPFPGTELYDIAVREGYFTGDGDFNKLSVRIPNMELPEAKPRRLKWLQIQGYLRFYCRPRRLLKTLHSPYSVKTFVSSLLDYFSVAASYYTKKAGNQPH